MRHKGAYKALPPSAYSAERALIVAEFAAKIAAAELFSRPDEKRARIEALRREEHAKLTALKARVAAERGARLAEKAGIAFDAACHEITLRNAAALRASPTRAKRWSRYTELQR